VREGAVDGDQQCVCVLTGNGLKDPDTAVAGVDIAAPIRRDDLDAIGRLL
jgi:threonine synthase